MEKYINLKLYLFTIILLYVTCITDCGDGTSCLDLETCCPMNHNRFGCCPYDDAVCCEDKLHCCPYGYKCDIKRGKCLGNSFFKEIEMKDIRKVERNEIQGKGDNTSFLDKLLNCIKSYRVVNQEEEKLINESKGNVEVILMELSKDEQKMLEKCLEFIGRTNN
jgi:hypothetical protein